MVLNLTLQARWYGRSKLINFVDIFAVVAKSCHRTCYLNANAHTFDRQEALWPCSSGLNQSELEMFCCCNSIVVVTNYSWWNMNCMALRQYCCIDSGNNRKHFICMIALGCYTTNYITFLSYYTISLFIRITFVFVSIFLSELIDFSSVELDCCTILCDNTTYVCCLHILHILIQFLADTSKAEIIYRK